MPVLLIVILSLVAFILLWMALAIPATLTLPRGVRPGLGPLTLDQAADSLHRTGQTGPELIEAARALTGERIVYCRRNSFDGSARCFKRGYGYCQQYSFALRDLLWRLGFEAEVVQSFQTEFLEDGHITPHAWVRVEVNGQVRDLDPIFWDRGRNAPTFEARGRVTGYPGWFRALAWWGSIGVNAIRYYRSGSDH